MVDKDKLFHLKQLARGAGIAFIFGIFGYCVMFFFKLIAARYFGPGDFGLFSLVETILGVCVIISGLGIANGIPRYIPFYEYSGKKKLLKGYLDFVFKSQFIIPLIVSLFILFFSERITLFFDFPDIFSSLLMLIALGLPFKVWSGVLRKFFVAKKMMFYSLFSYNIIEKVFLLGGVLLIYFLNLNIFYLVMFLFLGIVSAFIFDFLVYKFKVVSIKSKSKKYLIKEWLYFSFPLFFTGIFAFIISWTDNIVIGRILNPEKLGIYSIAFSLAMFLLFFQSSFSGIFMPLISENYAKRNHNKIHFLFRKSSAWIFGLTFPLFLILFFYSRQILTLLYGASFSSGYIPLMILSFGALINISTGLSSGILMLHRKTKVIFFVNLFISLFNIGLNLTLIPLIGIIGAALSSSISIAIQNLFLLFIARKYEKIGFDWNYNLKFIISGLPSIMIAAYFFRINLPIWIAVIISLATYSLIYLFILLLLKTFKEEDFQIILALEKKFGLDLVILKRIVKYFY